MFDIYNKMKDVYSNVIDYIEKSREACLTQKDEIVSEIITDDMSDEEKVNAVTVYVVNHMKYDLGVIYKFLEYIEKEKSLHMVCEEMQMNLPKFFDLII